MNAAYYELLLDQQPDLLSDTYLFQEIMRVYDLLKKDKLSLFDKLNIQRIYMIQENGNSENDYDEINELLEELTLVEEEIKNMDKIISRFNIDSSNFKKKFFTSSTERKIIDATKGVVN